MRAVTDLRYAFARLLWTQWTLNRFINRLGGRHSVIVEGYDIVFDGFPRSSNTFGAFMLLATQEDCLKVLLHEHRPAIFHRAARLGKPACLTLRDPLDAVASWVVYTGNPIREVLDYYIFFYEVLLPDRSRFLVLPFPVVVGDYPLVLRLINQRFGLRLTTDFDLEACRDDAFRRIEALFTDEHGNLDPMKVPRPEAARRKLQSDIRAKILSPRHANRVKRCRELYDIYHAEYAREMDRLQAADAGSRTDFQLPRMSR
jgi:hypothetical protein